MRTTEPAMPLYEYELCEGNCQVCDGPALEACPLCRKPMRKVISQVSTPRIMKPLSVTDAKKAGFTVLKRVSKGEYERL
jgi:predicted nucleic acid-binding Zn ribbon protein